MLKKGEFAYIHLGVAMELPKGYEALINPRSSAHKNFKIIQSNSQGVIDESYKGPDDWWMMPVIATQDTIIHKNDRICQFRIIEHQPDLIFETVKVLKNENRGGTGSSGTN